MVGAPGTAGLGELKIRSLELVPIVAPLPRAYGGSYYRMTNRATLLTRVLTEEGITGEAYVGDEDATLDQILRIVRDEIGPRVVGEDAFAVERLWRLAYPVTFDQLRDRRVGLVAMAAVDHAVWDAIGKALGQPLWRLWGGFRDRMPVNIIGGYYGPDLAGIAEEVAEWKQMGFRGCKFKIGRLSPEEDAARVRAVREAAGDDFVITIDANQGYEVDQALDLCARVAELGIRWFEEPCQWHNDRRALREVRARGGIPVCAGQSEFSASGCRDLMDAGSIDVCNFDSSWSGGATAWRRMAAAAQLYDVAVGHHEEPHVSLHLLASQPHATYAEVFHPDRDPIWWQLNASRPQLEDGWMQLSRRPGLGWELDPDFIERFRIDR